MIGHSPQPSTDPPFPAPPKTLWEALERARDSFPDRGVEIFDSRGRSTGRRSWPQIVDGAGAAARRLVTAGLAPGERILVCMPTGQGFLEGWLGALLAGALPVAVAPPGALGSARPQLEKLERVRELLDPRLVLCSERVRSEAKRLGLEPLAGLTRLSSELDGSPAAADLPPPPDPAQPAFLQLTSGSTGHPRAVVIGHGSVVHNVLASSEALGTPVGGATHLWARTMVSWLPLYHDMGLIGGVLYSLINGLDLALMSSRAFLRRPLLWLQLLSSRGPAISPAPNFAYQMCVDRLRPEQLEGLDLRNWKVAVTGSEMVRPESARAFVDDFGDRGFAGEALRPGYGLAEATLAVTFDCRGEGVRTVRPPAGALEGAAGDAPVVSTGVPIRDTRVAIVAPDGGHLPEDRIGEVWIAGPGVFAGYWGNPAATAEALQDGWHRTGDLGFLRDGELYLTGRLKEILIVRGQNLMPHEVEWIAEDVLGRGGATRCAVFPVPGGGSGEQAVLVAELHGQASAARLEALGDQVRSRVGRELSLPLADLVFVRRGRIPRTSSGKVQRRALRASYLAGEIERLKD